MMTDEIRKCCLKRTVKGDRSILQIWIIGGGNPINKMCDELLLNGSVSMWIMLIWKEKIKVTEIGLGKWKECRLNNCHNTHMYVHSAKCTQIEPFKTNNGIISQEMLFFWRNKHNIFCPGSNNFYIISKKFTDNLLRASEQWSRSRWTMMILRRVTQTTMTTMTTTTRGTGAGTLTPRSRSLASDLFRQRWTRSSMPWHR